MFIYNLSNIFKNSLFKKVPLVLFFILPLVTCSLWGQVVQKKQLTSADYKLWSNLSLDKIAPNEKWASYKIEYENGIDTLFIRNIIDKKTYYFPSGKQSLFTKDNYFVCLTKSDLQITNLHNGEKEILSQVSKYSYSPSNNILILHFTAEKKNILALKKPFGKTIKEFSDVTEYSLSPDANQLICNISNKDKNSVYLNDLKKNSSKSIMNISNHQCSNFKWDSNNKAVAFYRKSAKETIEAMYFYKLTNTELFEFDPAKYPNFPKTGSIVNISPNEILISDDLQRVFFTIKEAVIPPLEKTGSKVEIWNTNDKFTYHEEQAAGKFEEAPKVSFWEPLREIFTQITTNDLPSIILGGNKDFALLSNPKAYEPQFEFEGPRDYYIMDLNTLKKHIILANLTNYYLGIFSSPSGKYISYYKDNNWWTYNIKSQEHTNLTSRINVPFYGKVHTLASNQPFGNPCWSIDDNEIILYDEFDIWAIKPDGSICRRLTHGRESKIKFRIADKPNKNIGRVVYDSFLIDKINLEDEILLYAVGADGKTGYYKWKNGNGEQVILYGDSYLSDLHIGTKKQNIFCIEQRFDLPPRLIVKEKSLAANCIFQSNPQHENYQWGKAELIHFQNSKKEDLNGILYYPASYDPSKKYPMIVEIYELQSHELHFYSNPTLNNQSGINPALYSSEGYFYFMPDIRHIDQNVGPSSLDCVVSGTKKIIEKGLVNPDKIALMGHSFGGYETAFIANHTNVFTTAVASGAITDLSKFYLTMGWNTHKPEMTRFGKEQWRLEGKTPFSDREDFERNSPLTSIEKLKTPLLMWSGKQDTQVNPDQSLEYYLALRRLGIKSILLLYPDEGHVLAKMNNQQDLANRLLDWFGYYLKDENPSEWIIKGMF